VNNEATKRPVLQSMAKPSPTQSRAAMPVHGMVVPTPKRKQTRRALRTSPRVLGMKRLNQRIDELIKLDFTLMQVSKIIGSSYSGLHRSRCNDLNFSEKRIGEFHKKLDAWCKQVGAI